jgi:hypothetical protein
MMEKNEFIYWLIGFTEDKNTLSLVEMDVVKEKLEDVLDAGINRDYNLGYFPNPFSGFVENSPYTYPGMAGIESVQRAALNLDQDQLVQEMEEHAKDVDIINIIKEGMYVCDSYGDDHFLDWDDVDAFIEERKMYDEGSH